MEVPLGTNLLGSLIEYIRTSEPQVSKQDTGTRGGVGVHDLPLTEYEKWECIPPNICHHGQSLNASKNKKKKADHSQNITILFCIIFEDFTYPPRCLTDGFSLDLHVLL